MLQDLPFDIASLHAAYASGTDPRDVAAESFRRIEAAGDPAIFLHLVDRAAAAAAAAALPPFDPVAYPLWGVPFAAKDNIDAEGCPTTFKSGETATCECGEQCGVDPVSSS